MDNIASLEKETMQNGLICTLGFNIDTGHYVLDNGISHTTLYARVTDDSLLYAHWDNFKSNTARI